MMQETERRLPVGIQSFSKIRKGGYLYVDKTDLVWRLVNEGDTYNYLSRPRRFGKSLLVDTFECYFTAQKELFYGLKIMELEQEWVKRPVIRLDMSQGGDTAQDLRSYLNKTFTGYEQEYDIPVDETDSFANRLDGIIRGAYRQTGAQVAILIDEYDYPLQHSWMTGEHEKCASIYRNMFTVVKSDDKYERFVFITGITKFTQISLFSALNNLTNISFEPEYASICGITEAEIQDNFQPELQKMAERNHWTAQETHDRLKEYYDGYHFSEDNMVDIYNPFSLINALNKKKIQNYWIASGATTLLAKFVKDAEIRLNKFEGCRLRRNTLECSDVTGGGAELFLYQSGYLTIKDSDEFGYVLGFPNEEVKQALYDSVLPALTMRGESDIQSIQADLNYLIGTAQIPEAMKCLRSLIADVPYSNKKLASMDMEERYRFIISNIFNSLGLRVEVERMLSGGRIDMVVWTSRYIYVMELKLQKNGGKEAGLKQIQEKGYMEPFYGDKRRVIGLAVELDDFGKGLLDWQTVDE